MKMDSRTSKANELKLTVNTMYQIQQTRIALGLRIQTADKNGWVASEFAQKLMDGTAKHYQDAENEVAREMTAMIQSYRIWSEWFIDIKGVGPRYAGLLISKLCEKRQAQYDLEDVIRWGPHPEDLPADAPATLEKLGTPTGKVRQGIICFETISSVWAYCGLHTVDGKAAKRTKGKAANWSSKLKATAFLIGSQFCKTPSSAYRPVFDNFRAKAEDNPRFKSKGHKHNHSIRLTAKVFLGHVWTVQRALEGLPVSPPLVLASESAHTHFIPPLRNEGDWEGLDNAWSDFGPPPDFCLEFIK